MLINMANKSYSWYLLTDFEGLKAQLKLDLHSLTSETL